MSFLRWPLSGCRASDKCARDKRKTINGDDLLWALHTLGFEEYVEPLKVYLHKYREVSFPESAAGRVCFTASVCRTGPVQPVCCGLPLLWSAALVFLP